MRVTGRRRHGPARIRELNDDDDDPLIPTVDRTYP
jgi:hypothetical protein